mmetsp:Transcript_49085/g.98767  ORF Transcript_49085/g.98767 Transcript_49085/m.98767 type:complete len:236 (+) Transcript_49085:337-1044(+)
MPAFARKNIALELPLCLPPWWDGWVAEAHLFRAVGIEHRRVPVRRAAPRPRTVFVERRRPHVRVGEICVVGAVVGLVRVNRAGVEPVHVARGVVPDGQHQHHPALEGLPHLLQPPKRASKVVVLLVQALLACGHVVCERACRLVRESRHGLRDARQVSGLRVGHELGPHGDGFGRVDQAEKLVARAPTAVGVHVGSHAVALVGALSAGVGVVAHRGEGAQARVRRQGAREPVGLH